MNAIPVYNKEGKQLEEVSLHPSIYDVQVNEALVHEVVTILQGNKRIAIAHTKNRAEISGGGRKPWRQKGTGRARAGSNRSPLWRGGGVVFGPTNERNFTRKINKKAKRKALFMCLSDKVREGNLIIVDEFAPEMAKAKETKQWVAKHCSDKESCLLVVESLDDAKVKSVRNLQKVDMMSAHSLNVLDVLKNTKLIVTKQALQVIEETFLAS